MNQNNEVNPEPEPANPFAEAIAYLAKEGVDANQFPPEKLKRLQWLLTAEPDAGCRVWPDPTWDPIECQEACEEFYREFVEMEVYVAAFRLGGLNFAEDTLAAMQAKEPEQTPAPAPTLGGIDLTPYVSKDHRTATERALDFYRHRNDPPPGGGQSPTE